MITSSPDYILAQEFIKFLCEDVDLKDLVFPCVFDKSDQASQLRLIAQAYQTCIAVSLDNPEPLFDTKRPRHFNATLLLQILSMSNVGSFPEPHESLNAYQAALVSRLIVNINQWSRANTYDLPDLDPCVTAIADLDLTNLPTLDGLEGKAIIVQIPLKF